MKKTIQQESTYCDFCGKSSYEKCLGCGKDVCWECQKKEGIDFKHAVHFSGSSDGFYCSKCLGNQEIIDSELFKAYQHISNLRAEEATWYKNFNIRCELAEETLKRLIN